MPAALDTWADSFATSSWAHILPEGLQPLTLGTWAQISFARRYFYFRPKKILRAGSTLKVPPTAKCGMKEVMVCLES
jgi:hypothetical protein